jgi:5'-nucleotidase
MFGASRSVATWVSVALAVTVAMTFIWTATARSAPMPDERTVKIQVLSTNDFHGRLNPQTVSGSPAGGAAWLSAYLKRAEADNPEGTLMMDGGDLVGATPLESAAFEDRPTIDVANAIGYDDVTFGNHEFDAGTARLREQVRWATFPYWSANVIDQSTGKPFLHPAPYEIFQRRGVNIGVIDLTTEATPSIVNPSGIAGLSFASTVNTANMAVAKLKKRGIQTIVVVGHLGTDQCLPEPKPGCDGNTLVTDPNDIAKNEAAKLASEVDDEVDLIVAGHTHQGVNTIIDGKRVVEAYSYGTAYADVDMKVSPDTGDVATSSANVIRTWHNDPKTGRPAITPDAEVQKIVDEANEAVAPIKNEVVGYTGVNLTRTQYTSVDPTQGPADPPGGESNLGDVATDAMNWRADQLEGGAVDFAFTNSGGIRADILKDDPNAVADPVTFGEVVEAFPFQNVLATTTLTGAQVKQVLEQGASGQFGMVQVSGLSFTYDPSQPVGSRVTSTTVNATGQELQPAATYRVVTNDFMYNGGDNYTMFKQGANPVIYSDQLLYDVVSGYVGQFGPDNPINQKIEGRITIKPATA